MGRPVVCRVDGHRWVHRTAAAELTDGLVMATQVDVCEVCSREQVDFKVMAGDEVVWASEFLGPLCRMSPE